MFQYTRIAVLLREICKCNVNNSYINGKQAYVNVIEVMRVTQYSAVRLSLRRTIRIVWVRGSRLVGQSCTQWRVSARGNSIGWSVLRLTSSCTYLFELFKFEQVVI